ncbi:MAG: nucleotidyl transferase AbiEii/AbiGii toxin family protein [Elusimicrobia bacterium]|nr:nucleotidyl transferase AbiEii/AbiGii toxin family protein [Elusimicrobiota bacterium]
MIDYNYVRKLSEEIGVPEETIEKDFCIELLLNRFCNSALLIKNLVFRGGTALKKMYFPEFRYSEDLDFILKSDDSLSIYEKTIEHILNEASKHLPVVLKIKSIFYPQRGHLQIFILYDIITEIHSTKELKIDIIEDSIVLPSQNRKTNFSFEYFKKLNCFLNTYNLESIIAEKIGRILDVVDEPRDLWDLLYLLKSKIKISDAKKSFRKKYGTEINVTSLCNAIKSKNYKKMWDVRLKNQIPNLTEYETVVKELEILIKSCFGNM